MGFLDDFERVPNQFQNNAKTISIRTNDVQDGVNGFDDCIVYKNDTAITVYDRICDHNGGKIITKANGISECPLHGWRFDPASGTYSNVGAVQKKPLLKIDTRSCPDTLEVPLSSLRRTLLPYESEQTIRIRHLNHACLVFQTPHYKFAVDPWIIGPAFSRGWWLANPSPADSFDELNSCDFIYISHNHPDHLHPQSLAQIRDDMPILTAAFETGSTDGFLRELGFTQVVTLDFQTTFADQKNEFAFAALKSGDFRDDSGLLVQCGSFSAGLLVDSNYCDFYRFPENMSVLASTFTGGASGFPLCFETQSKRQKDFILTRSRSAVRSTIENTLSLVQPKYFIPYAGMFQEQAQRDRYIKENNQKNEISAYEVICERNNVQLLNVLQYPEMRFEGEHLKSSSTPSVDGLKDDTPETYITSAKQNFSLVAHSLAEEYFLASNYQEDLDLYLTETDDSFERVRDKIMHIKFRRNATPRFQWLQRTPDLPSAYAESNVNVLHIKVRFEALSEVMHDHLPWEDISIGFQCRINRSPDVYNSSFWFYFTNIYVKETARRMAEECSACTKLEQSLVPDITQV